MATPGNGSSSTSAPTVKILEGKPTKTASYTRPMTEEEKEKLIRMAKAQNEVVTILLHISSVIFPY